MIKKLVLGYLAFAITLLLGVNIYYASTENKLSDEEMMNLYIEETCGEDYVGILLPDKCSDKYIYIYFAIYKPDGSLMFKDWCFEREYLNNYIDND